MADIHISAVTVASSTPVRGDIHVSSVAVTSGSTTLEPYQLVQLPAGTWTRTSGPTVTITGGRTFTAPALAAGGTLVVTESGGAVLTFTILPHTVFFARGSVWIPVQISVLHASSIPGALVVGTGRVDEGTTA